MDFCEPRRLLGQSDIKKRKLEKILQVEVQNSFLSEEIMESLEYLEEESFRTKIIEIEKVHKKTYLSLKREELSQRIIYKNELIDQNLKHRLRLEEIMNKKLNHQL